MARADVLQLVDTLSGGLADSQVCNSLLDDVVRHVSLTTGQFVRSELIAHALGEHTFPLPSGAVQLLACFYDGKQLSATTQRALEGVDPDWRDRVGTPQSVIEETEGPLTFRLTPIPSTPSGDLSFPNGAPLGVDYPSDIIHVLFLANVDPLPPQYELPIALLVIGREFSRESDHSNAALAKAASDLAALLLEQLG